MLKKTSVWFASSGIMLQRIFYRTNKYTSKVLNAVTSGWPLKLDNSFATCAVNYQIELTTNLHVPNRVINRFA